MAYANSPAILASGTSFGGVYLKVSYEPVGETGTTYSVQVTTLQMVATRANPSNGYWYGFRWDSTTDSVGIQMKLTDATTQTSKPSSSTASRASGQYTTYTWTFDKTYTWSKGHMDQTVYVTGQFSSSTAAYWGTTNGSTGGFQSLDSTSTSASFGITVPALESWTVTLDAQGGTGADPTLSKWCGEDLALPQPVKSGYTFAGWADESDPTTVVYDPGDDYTDDGAADLVAVWTPAITAAYITQVFAERDDGSGTWSGGRHTSADDGGEYVYVRAWWRVDGAASATVSLGAAMADSSTTVWTGTGQTAFKPGTGELYAEGVAEWVTSQTAAATGQYTVTVTISAGGETDQKAAVISTAFFTIDVLAGGHGIAFGKPATQTGVMDIGFDVNIDGKELGAWIVGTGTDTANGWEWVKFSDGTYRARWSGDIALSAGTAWGGFYFHQQSAAINVPSFSQTFEVVSAVKNNSVLSFYVGRTTSTTAVRGYWVTASSGSSTSSTFGTVTYTIEGTY